MRHLTRLLAATTTALFIGFGSTASAVEVDVELQLLVDVSGSIDSTEFGLQRDGYVNAFKNQNVIDAILDTSNGRLGRIAVELIYWSNAGDQDIISRGWELIDSQQDAINFANWVSFQPRPSAGVALTAPGNAIAFGAALFNDNGYEGRRNVIDISGDGSENDGIDTSDARDAALAGGIDAINGLVILNEEPGTFDFYLNNVIGGSGSFIEQTQNFGDFEDALVSKLEREITSLPEPAAMILLALGLGALAAGRREV